MAKHLLARNLMVDRFRQNADGKWDVTDLNTQGVRKFMLCSWHWNAFYIIGPLWGESNSHSFIVNLKILKRKTQPNHGWCLDTHLISCNSMNSIYQLMSFSCSYINFITREYCCSLYSKNLEMTVIFHPQGGQNYLRNQYDHVNSISPWYNHIMPVCNVIHDPYMMSWV